MNFKITFILLLFCVTCFSQPAFVPLPNDTLIIELNADISSNLENFGVHIELENTTQDTLMMVWRKDMQDCPEEWETAIADPQQHFFFIIFSNYDTVLNLNAPVPMLPDQLAQYGFGVELYPRSTPGCCTIPVHFSVLEAPDSIISTAYFRFAINDPSCDFVNDSEAVKNEVSVFPNPTDDVVFIKSVSPVQMVQVFNLYGQLLKTEVNRNKVGLSNLPGGIYIFKVKLSNGDLIWQKIEKV